MIVFKHLTKKFGKIRAVEEVSLTIAPGESVALWGVNGAGKTTIIRCLAGLYGYEGSIAVNGLDAHHDGKSARRLIGYVPQELSFQDDLRVQSAIRFFAALRGLRVHDVDPVLAGVGLLGHGGKRVRELSGGMKQRLALAIALLGDPPILLLDEVTASLDARGRAELISLLGRLVRGSGRTVLFASHRVEEIESLATRVIVMDTGKVSEDVPARSFISRQCRTALLHLYLDPDQCGRAVSVLVESGFDARLNGRGIFVPVLGGQRMRPIQLLAGAGIVVQDLEFLTHSHAEGGHL